MKSLDGYFRSLRDKPQVVGSRRKVELIPLNQEIILSDWIDEGTLGVSQIRVYGLASDGTLYASEYPGLVVYKYITTNNWQSIGSPGSVFDYVRKLFFYNGNLYALAGSHMYRWDGGTTWTDMGRPHVSVGVLYDASELNGNLYVSTGNIGNIYRFDGVGSWTDLGNPPGYPSESLRIIAFDGTLYVGSGQMLANVYRWNSGTSWTNMGQLGSDSRVDSLGVFEGKLYGGTYLVGAGNGGHVWRMDGMGNWADCGRVGVNNSVQDLIEYEGTFYAGGYWEGRVFYYDGNTTWTALEQLGSSDWIEVFCKHNNGLYVGTGQNAKVYSATVIGGIDITQYVENIGKITKRIERNLNQFQPPNVSVTVMDVDIFFKQDETGLFDSNKLNRNYRLKIWVGLQGSEQWVLIFDGKVNADSIRRDNRETIVFSAIGWLDDAVDYNAELVADPDNSPFKTITGVNVPDDPDAIKNSLGIQTLEYTIEADDKKYLSFSDGKKKEVTDSPETYYNLKDAEDWGRMRVRIPDFSKLPSESKTDKFTIINYAPGVKRACYWWENRSLEFMINKLADKHWGEGVGERDIKVEEMASNADKEFIYLPPIYPIEPPIDMLITDSRVVNVSGSLVTLLVGFEVEKGVSNEIHRIVIDVNDPTNYTDSILPIWGLSPLTQDYRDSRVCRFIYFNGSTWAVMGKEFTIPFHSNIATRWYCTGLLKFASNWALFDDEVIPTNDPPSSSVDKDYNVHLANTFSANPNQTSVYSINMIAQWAVGSPLQSFEIRKYDDNTSIWSTLKTTTDRIPGDTAQYTRAGAKDYYYYENRKAVDTSYVYLRWYNITDDTAGLVIALSQYGNLDNNNRVLRFAWTKEDGWLHVIVYIKQADGEMHYLNWWIKDLNVNSTDEGTTPKTLYMSESTEFNERLTSWRNADGELRPAQYVDTYMFTEPLFLFAGYHIDYTAPHLYGLSGSDYYWAGFCTAGYNIIPYIIAPEQMQTVMIADFSGMTIKDAYSKLAEAFICYFDIYEKNKLRFYYRNNYLGNSSVSWDKYLEQPKMKYWENWCDRVVVENKRLDLKWYAGSHEYAKKTITIQNDFIAPASGQYLADRILDYFGRRKKIIMLQIPFGVEYENMDKIPFTSKDMNGIDFWIFDTIVYETSFNSSPETEATHNMEMQLLQIVGDIMQDSILTQEFHTIVEDT